MLKSRTSRSVEVDREYIRRHGLHGFVQRAWPIIEPVAAFIDGWHIKLMCIYLERAFRGEITKLIINIPPGCSKSGIVSVFWPAWMWALRPELRHMYASHDGPLALRDSNRTKELVTSEWYQARWGEKTQVDRRKIKADTGSVYYTTAGGLRMSSTVAGRGVGWHGHIQVVDDPTKPADAAIVTGAMLDRANDWWRNTMSTRKADPKFFIRVIIMQRLHKKDLSGTCLEEGGWTHLCLPMEYEPDHEHVCKDDPRRSPGELLCSERFGVEEVEELKVALGPDLASAQLQQHPTTVGGNVFRKDWLGHQWLRLPDCDIWVVTWDHTFGSLQKKASYVVGQVWAFSGPNSYLVHQVRARMEFPEMLAVMREMRVEYPQAMTHYVEAKAAGPAIEQTLRHEYPGIVMVKADRTTGGKLARAQSVTGMFQSGHVWFPHSSKSLIQGKQHLAHWVDGMLRRVQDFTGSDADVADEVDAMTQVLIQMHGSVSSRFARAMAAAKKNK